MILQILWILLTLFCNVRPCIAQPAVNLSKLLIGKVAYSTPESILIAHEPIARHLQTQLKLDDVEFKLYLDYEQVYAALRKAEIDLAWLGSVFFVKQDEWAYPLVCPKWSGKSSYRGQILVRSDSDINNFADLRGKRFAFVSRTSSSGYIFPLALLRSEGLDIDAFAEFAFLDKHSTVVYALLARQFDAGAAYDGVLEEEAYKPFKDNFRVIGNTTSIHNEPLVIRPDLQEQWAEPIRIALTSLNSHEGSKILTSIQNLTGFQSVTRESYANLRKMVRYVE